MKKLIKKLTKKKENRFNTVGAFKFKDSGECSCQCSCTNKVSANVYTSNLESIEYSALLIG